VTTYRRRRRSRRPRFSVDATSTLVWTVIVVVIALPLGTYWVVRGIEHDIIVNRGAGVVEQPHISCTSGGGGTGSPVCTKNVKVYIDASRQTTTQTDVDGLYAQAESTTDKAFAVQAVYVDTTNHEVNKLVYNGTTYVLETNKKSFLASAIVALVVAAVAIGFLVYLLKRRRLTRPPMPS
jgi:hypothetical protein